jgi:hypothetical protein
MSDKKFTLWFRVLFISSCTTIFWLGLYGLFLIIKDIL